MYKQLIVAALAGALAACSAAPVAGVPKTVPATAPAAPADAAALACPANGAKIVKGNSYTIVHRYYTIVNSSLGPRFTVVFTKQSSDKQPVTFAPKLFTCGPRSGKTPIGTVTAGGGSTSTSCHNGVCTITVTYYLTYTPPSKVPGGGNWRYDLIRMDPVKPKPPYGVLPAFVIEVKTKL